MSVLASHPLRSEGMPGLQDWVVMSEQVKRQLHNLRESQNLSEAYLLESQMAQATPNETIVSRPDFCDFTCGRAVYYE